MNACQHVVTQGGRPISVESRKKCSSIGSCDEAARSMTRARRSAPDVERLLDELDPDATPALEASDLAAIGRAVDDRDRAEVLLGTLVRDARAHGKSWAMIGLALGVSKQAAQRKYAGVLASLQPAPRTGPVSRGA